MTLNNIFLCYTVSCSFILIKLHSSMSFECLTISVLVLLPSVLTLVITYIMFGDINQSAKRFLLSWKRKSGVLSRDVKTEITKFIRSSKPLRIELGNFGYYQKPASIRIIGKIVYYTVKYLLVMNSRFGL